MTVSSVFSPLVRAVIDSFTEGVIVFDHQGAIVYANCHAEAALRTLDGEAGREEKVLWPQLARLGARIAPLKVGELQVGEAIFIPASETRASTLADRERSAILETLEQTGWRLAESARRLGISRTTLWRRLKEYGLQQDGGGGWSQVF
jgi:transcriptional regulator with PAS, ATPase and Fis domain